MCENTVQLTMYGNPIRLLFVTGFLGSGKTTMIQDMLSHLRDFKVALILNDFGSIVVDTTLVGQSKHIVATKSLAGGQIFCSCLSGTFIETIEAMMEIEPDFIIVEVSGLAKPSTLLEMISIVYRRTLGKVLYLGMVCLVDTDRFSLLSKSLNAIQEQIIFSDWILLNKTDLIDVQLLDEVKAEVVRLRPLAPVFSTVYGEVSPILLRLIFDGSQNPASGITGSLNHGWGIHGRPKTCVFLPTATFKIEDIRSMCRKIAPHMLRMKGFLPDRNNNMILVDVVGPHITISDSDISMSFPVDFGIVCIFAANIDGHEQITQAWQAITGSDGSDLRIW